MLRATLCTSSVLLFVFLVGCGGGDGDSTVADAGTAPAPAASSGGGAEYDGGEYDGGESSSDYGDDDGGYDDYGSSDSEDDYGDEYGEAMDDYGEGYGAEEMDEEYDGNIDYGEGYGESDEDGYGESEMEDYDGYGESEMEGYGEYGEGPGGRQVKPQGLDGLADYSFGRGNEKDALHYLYAYALVNDEAAADLLSTFQWVPALRRPEMAVRWGFGIQLTAPRNFSSDPRAIGSTQQIGGAGGGGEGGYGGEDGYGGGEGDYGAEYGGESRGAGSAKNATVSRYAGDLGDQLLAAFNDRVKKGQFGRVLKDASGGGVSRGGAGGYPGGGGGYPGDESDYSGEEGYGDYGSEYGGGASRQGGGDAAGTVNITPGLNFVGIGSDQELLEKARAEELDLLCVFDVEIKLNVRQRQVINETGVIIYDLDPTKRGRDAEFVKTRPLNNIKVQVARQQKKDDGLEDAIGKLTEWVDQAALMTPLPEVLNAENVKRRVGELATAQHENPLPVLAEIKFWNRRDLLDDAIVAKAFEMIVGAEVAQTLLSGSEEEREAALEKWLPAKE